MTELTVNKETFLKTLSTIRTQFQLADSAMTLSTEPDGQRFQLSLKRRDSNVVQAFGPCAVQGEPVSIICDLAELEHAIAEAFEGTDETALTLLVANGIWVKDPVRKS